VDAQLGILFGELQKKGLTDKTLIVLTADHGESLGEHGELTHSFFAYNSTIHVPLIIAGPEIKVSRIRDYVSHIDLFPTVCELLSIQAPPSLQGESLVGLMKGKKEPGRPIYFEALESYLNKGCAPLRGFIEGSLKFMDSPIPELYDLARDFNETTNLAAKTDLAPYKKKLQDLEKTWSLPQRNAGAQVTDRETLEKLRSLGYVASPVAQTKSAYGPEDDLKSFLPFQQKLEAAIRLADEDKKEESIQTLKDLLAKRKDFTAAYTYLAGSYLSLNRGAEALKVLQEGSRDNPKNYTLLSSYGTLLVKAGQGDAAIEILQKALAILDFDAEVWDNLGLAFLGKGEFQKSLEYFEKAVTLDKNFAMAYSNMGAANYGLYFQTRRTTHFTACLENFQKAVALDPTLNLAWRGLGRAYWADRKLERAVAAWEKAVTTDMTDYDSTINLGQAYLEQGDKSRALRCFERYLSLRKDHLSPADLDKIQALIDKCKR
jgi:tetratricopeptide (TPR) repeat protein